MAKDTIGHKNQNSMPILAHRHEQQTIYKHSSKRAVAIQRQSYLKISTLSKQPDLKHAHAVALQGATTSPMRPQLKDTV